MRYSEGMSYSSIVEFLVKTITSQPEVVKVEEKTEDDHIVCYIQVSPDDVGKVIGKNGNMISNIRYFVGAVGKKQNEKVLVKVVTE